MRLAFCLFKYFPYGGLQRDFLRIAKACLARGHMIDVYTMTWDGDFEPGLAIRTIRVRGRQNHVRREDFVNQIKPYLAQGYYDLIIGFNKMPGLDVYFASDTCYQAKARAQHTWLYRLTGRYRHSVAYEKAVFAPGAKTQILLLSKRQEVEFTHYYHTPPDRLHLLPPGIELDRMAPSNADKIALKLREEYEMGADDFFILMVGSGFKTKGLDRSLIAFATLPPTIRNSSRLFIVGKDNPKPFLSQAKKLGILSQIEFLGGRNDVPRFLWAADLLLHPAYNENTGAVILEALAAGLPVLTTDVCGYAHYVQDADAGIVLPSPFKQDDLNKNLLSMLLSPEQETWRTNAIQFTKNADIYSLPDRAVSMIETFR